MTLPTDAQNRRRTPWYFLTILFFFILPVLTFLLNQWKKTNHKAFVKATLVITVLGYAWSILVSATGWWVFNPRIMLGIQILPHLPLEEALFYPLGGVLSILCYVTFCERLPGVYRTGKVWLGILLAFTLLVMGAILVSWINGNRPYYIASQVVLFNGLSLGLWFGIHEKMLLKPMAVTVLCMACIGFVWNWMAFNLGWWEYHAILGWMFPVHVPVDDWNFYVFAPIAAASLYCRFDQA